MLRQKEDELSKTQKQLTDLQAKYETQSTAGKEALAKFEVEKQTLEKTVSDLEGEKETLEEKNESLSEQLRAKELRRFASAYNEQEGEYKTQQDTWFKLNLGATALLVLSVLLSIFGPSWIQRNWYEEPGFYLLNAIFLTLFIYTLKQHSHFGNLRIDYANRKTLAQSYQYIIEDEEEVSDVTKRFLERAADVFSSKAVSRGSDVTIYEAILAKFLGHK